MLQKSWITPSWLILFLDAFIAVISVHIALLLRLNFEQDTYARYPLQGITFTVLLVHTLLSLLMRTNKGIIRHTGITDIARISALNATCSVVYCWADATITPPDGVRLFPLSVVLINFFICTSSLLFYRLLIKWLFMHIRNYKSAHKVRAAVYSAGYPGLMVHEAVSNESCQDIRVVAFLESGRSHRGKVLKGLPVYAGIRGLEQLLKLEKISLLIIAEDLPDKVLFKAIMERCLEQGIKIQQVQPAGSWIKGEPCVKLKDLNVEDMLERSVIHIHNEKVVQELQGKRILVTGAAGSIGRGIVRQLVTCNPAVIVLCDNAESPLYELEMEMQELAPELSVVPFIASVCDRTRMQQLFDVYEPEIVFHAAAYKHVPMMENNPTIAVINNVLGTRVLAELAVAYGVSKFVLVSTDKAVNPTNIMGASKRIAEMYVQSYNNYLGGRHGNKPAAMPEGQSTRFITTRFGNVLGSNGSVIPRFRQQIEKGGPLTVTHPEMTRYFMAIPEACQLLLEASVMGEGGEIFVFDMGKPVKIADLAKKMIMMAGRLSGQEIGIVYTGLRPGEKLYEELLNNAENTLPTYHEKIMIASARSYDFNTIRESVDILTGYARKHDVLQTVSLMKQMVPEFISNNSVYTALDKEQVVL